MGFMMRTMKYCNYCLLNYTILFNLKTFIPACHSPLLLCPKLPLLAAILRQKQDEMVIKYKSNDHNNTILYANIFTDQITNYHQQLKHIP